MNFSIRIDNLEVRSCGEHLLQKNPHNTAEILRWEFHENDPGVEFCYVLAYWVKNKEGYDLSFVNDRPFDKDIPDDTFMFLAGEGQKILNTEFAKGINSQ